MASTNKYSMSGLNQWVETDYPEMEDFNEDNHILTDNAMWKAAYDNDGSVAVLGGIKSAIESALSSGGGFALYTHSKSGTIHTLTNTGNGDSLRFIATANFTLGDTFTINGVACTPKIITGSAPPDLFFAAGSWVIAFIQENTIFFPVYASIPSSEAIYITTGSANNYVLTPTPAITSYIAGQRFYVKFHTQNTSPTVNINISGLGNKRIYKFNTDGPTAGQLPNNSVWEIIYDGTAFHLVSGGLDPVPMAGGTFTGDIYARTADRNENTIRNNQVFASGGTTLVSTNSLKFVRE